VEKTIKVHRGRIMHKMGAASLVDLVRMADLAGVRPAPAQLPATDTPGLNALREASGSDVGALAYTVPYAIGQYPAHDLGDQSSSPSCT